MSRRRASGKGVGLGAGTRLLAPRGTDRRVPRRPPSARQRPVSRGWGGARICDPWLRKPPSNESNTGGGSGQPSRGAASWRNALVKRVMRDITNPQYRAGPSLNPLMIACVPWCAVCAAFMEPLAWCGGRWGGGAERRGQGCLEGSSRRPSTPLPPPRSLFPFRGDRDAQVSPPPRLGPRWTEAHSGHRAATLSPAERPPRAGRWHRPDAP